MGIAMVFKRTIPPVPEEWMPVDNDDWPASTGNWDGSEWTPEYVVDQYVLELSTPTGTWSEDFRPTMVRVTVSTDLINTSGSTITCECSDPLINENYQIYTDLKGIELTPLPGDTYDDLQTITLTSDTDFTVTNVELYSPDPVPLWSPTWTLGSADPITYVPAGIIDWSVRDIAVDFNEKLHLFDGYNITSNETGSWVTTPLSSGPQVWVQPDMDSLTGLTGTN